MAENKNYTEQEEHSKVIKGNVKVEKPKLSKRLVNFLLSDKLDSIGNYLAQCILGPSLKDLVFKLGMGALQMGLYGGNIAGMPNNSGTYIPGYGYQTARRDPVPYNTMANPGYMGYGYPAQPAPAPYMPGNRVSINDISFDTKDDAHLVLDRMRREISRYGKVKLADFYTYSGVTGQESNWTLQGSGWYDIGNAVPIMRTDGRWIIDFPPVQNLR